MVSAAVSRRDHLVFDLHRTDVGAETHRAGDATLIRRQSARRQRRGPVASPPSSCSTRPWSRMRAQFSVRRPSLVIIDLAAQLWVRQFLNLSLERTRHEHPPTRCIANLCGLGYGAHEDPARGVGRPSDRSAQRTSSRLTGGCRIRGPGNLRVAGRRVQHRSGVPGWPPHDPSRLSRHRRRRRRRQRGRDHHLHVPMGSGEPAVLQFRVDHRSHHRRCSGPDHRDDRPVHRRRCRQRLPAGDGR